MSLAPFGGRPRKRTSGVDRSQPASLVWGDRPRKESWKDANGNWQSRTDRHRIVFGKQAEFTRALAKGSYVIVQGAVRTREYERDGAKHRIVEVRADRIAKLDRSERRADAEGEP